jgi:hypothetical protein
MDNFVRLGAVNTNAATPSGVSIDQIKENMKRGLPKLENLPDFQKEHNKIASIVGGGPSLKETIGDLKGDVFAAGSSNDFLAMNGITPKYSIQCDPDAITGLYITNTNDETIYLIASCCHTATFDKLKNRKVYTWHSFSEDQLPTIKEVDPQFYAISGGCTVGLRAINIGVILGYKHFHLFGFDSCLGPDDEDHAYKLADGDTTETGRIFKVRAGVDQPGDKVYNCIGYQLAQASHFLEYYRAHYKQLDMTVHGGGLISDLVDIENKRMAIMEKGFF